MRRGDIEELAKRGTFPVIFLCPRAPREWHGGLCLVKPIDLSQLRRHLAHHFLARVA
ncbi:hypothetical protein D3C83_229530 [compost metagenome]